MTRTAELSIRVGNSSKWTPITTRTAKFFGLINQNNLSAAKQIFHALGTESILRSNMLQLFKYWHEEMTQ